VLAGRKAGRYGRDHPFEQVERTVEQGIIAPVLDHAAGVRYRRAVAAEQPAGVGERQPAHDVGKIHGDLAGERDLGAAPRDATQVLLADAEHLHHGLLDRLARDTSHMIVMGDQRNGFAFGLVGAMSPVVGLQHRQKSE
jgi:hypothetical protein